ncbi:MAG: four helix bundle protein [Patescibacteria group bacterium]|nr:four helix bundle protein [Patescibacteria group bacterium]
MASNKEFSDQFKRRIYKFILDLIKYTDTLAQDNSLCRVATNQLLRCGTSVGANYIEAIASASRKEFTNFLSISLKSANETKFWLALLRDSNRGSTDEINKLLKEIMEISNMLGSSIRTLRVK